MTSACTTSHHGRNRFLHHRLHAPASSTLVDLDPTIPRSSECLRHLVLTSTTLANVCNNTTTQRSLPSDTTALNIVLPQTPPASPEEASCQSFGLRQLQCQVVTLAKQYQDFDFSSYGGQGQQEEVDQAGQVTTAEYEQLLTQGFAPPNPYLQTPQKTPTQTFAQHGMQMLPSQISAPEPAYSVEQPMYPSQMSRHVSQAASSHYGSPYESPQVLAYQQQQAQNPQPVYQQQQQPSRKRSRVEELSHYDYQGVQQLQAAAGQVPLELTPRGHHAQLQADFVGSQHYQIHQSSPQQSISGQSQHSGQQQQATHHHHRLPHQPPASKVARLDLGEGSAAHAPPSAVGQPGMPQPAAKPKGPKLKFTPEDDTLLVELKETKNLTWKQIAEFFPGRSSGTLQVRYCTKLKAKTTAWTDEMIQRLRNAIQEYENDRWRIISGKVGNGFSAAACRDQAAELDDITGEGREEDVATAASTPQARDVDE